MPDIPHLPPPVLIAEPAALADLARQLQREPRVAVDTESNSLFAYRERVCLLQFSTLTDDYLVDPLSLPAEALQALRPLFADPRVEKVFHAAEYDLIGLKRDYGFELNGLFDTMLAARTLGWPQMGLAAILETHFGVKMNKKLQRADWGRRPLPPPQLDYARLDTRYLLPLRDILQAELERTGALEEVGEEFERLAGLNPEPNGHEPPAFWRISGARDLSPRQAAVLQALHAYRDQQARRLDRPPFKVLADRTLLEISRRPPAGADELAGLPGMTPGQMRRHAAGLLRAVQRGLAAPPATPPHAPREPDEVRERYDRLHQWRKRRAQARGVESDVILPREALWELARRAPRSLEALADLRHLGPWRRRTYGQELLEVLNN